MKQFTYKALDKDGKPASGVVENISDKQAVRTLQGRGLMVVELREKTGLSWGNFFSIFGLANKVSTREVATITRLLATMLETGLPLTDALINLATQTRGTYLGEVIRSIQTDVRSGVSLSESLGRYPEVFNSLYINLIKAGEASGKVGETMEKLADTLEAGLDFESKVRGAMTYPAIVLTAMVGVAVFMLVSIVPQISVVYKEYGADLPLPTRMLMGLSGLVTNYFLIVLAVLVFGFFLYRTLRKNQVSDYLINNAIFAVPVLGKIQKDVLLTVMTRTLGALLGAGVAIIDALGIVSKILGNNLYRVGLEAAAKAVEKGVPLSVAISRDENFPLMISQLLAIGEETGTVDQSLLRLGKFYQEAVERQTKTLTTAMEPLLILLMGIGVGGLAIAILLPLFNLANVIH